MRPRPDTPSTPDTNTASPQTIPLVRDGYEPPRTLRDSNDLLEVMTPYMVGADQWGNYPQCYGLKTELRQGVPGLPLLYIIPKVYEYLHEGGKALVMETSLEPHVADHITKHSGMSKDEAMRALSHPRNPKHELPIIADFGNSHAVIEGNHRIMAHHFLHRSCRCWVVSQYDLKDHPGAVYGITPDLFEAHFA